MRRQETTVFVTDGSIRRTLVAARALNRAGHTVVSGEHRTPNLTSASRASTTSVRYPDPVREPRQFVDHLLAYLHANPVDVLLPMAQDTLDLVLARRDEFEALTRLPFAPNERVMVFRDKARTMALAAVHGFPVPRTVWARTADPSEVDLGNLTFPLVVKPRTGWASRGVTIVETAADFPAAYTAGHEHSPFPLVQEFIPVREKYHVNVLLGYEGELLAACAIKELRHHPPGIGPSTAQLSVDRPDLVDLAVAVLRSNDWFGLASIDVLIDDRTGAPLVGEVNPRFWGSLNAAIAAGVNFPALIVALALGRPVQPVIGGNAGHVNRSVLPYELLHLASTVRSRTREPGFFKFRGSTFDIVSLKDPLPTLAFVVDGARQLLDPEAWTQLAHMERVGAVVQRITGRQGRDENAVAAETAPLFAAAENVGAP